MDSVFVSLLGLHGFLVGSTWRVSLFPCKVYMVSLLGKNSVFVSLLGLHG